MTKKYTIDLRRYDFPPDRASRSPLGLPLARLIDYHRNKQIKFRLFNLGGGHSSTTSVDFEEEGSMKRLLTFGLSATATVALLQSALAQQVGEPLGQQAAPQQPVAEQPNPNVAILNRRRPDFSPLGIRAGQFLIFPSIGVLGEYDDNVRATNDDEDTDYSVSFLPRITARSQWSRHELNATTFGDFAFFADDSDNNYQDFGFEIDGTLDINSRNIAFGDVGIARDHDQRDDPSEADSDDVTQFWDSSAALGYRHTFNRFFVQPRLALRRLGYEEAGDVSNDDRDRTQYGGDVRVGFSISPRFDAFVQGRYVRSVRDTNSGGGVKRDNTRYIGTIGTDIDITGVIFGEAQIGYEFTDFDESDLDSEQNPFAEAGITWNVTELTSILFDAFVGLEDSTVTVDGEEASSEFEQRYGIEVQHELLRNLILEANGRYERSDFEGVDRTDNTFRAGFGATYLVNRNISLIANYNYTHRNSDVDDQEFSRNIVRVGINLRL